jgi:chromosome segregation protein
MVQFSRLRLQGFKSFVDKTELEIAPGLNGIVGPNGCGKSNLVEALRWAMGESSAKRMRGDGMEDVIFNGTTKRASRNIAEVSLLLDNSDRKAPAQYNGQDEIEIVRKIERDKGSQYRINGKMMRARDVHMFFADSVSGANSPALVSQGRVTEIIKAKPMERRLILEDSAGISGLFVRRHEAELKLKAADNNLLRIEDLLAGMETRLNSLKRQAKQASRYRNINAQVRQLEIAIAYVEYQTILNRIKDTKAQFEAAESIVAEKLGVVTQLTKTQNTQSLDLPELRRKEAEAAAALQTGKIALQRIEDEAARQAEMLREAEANLERVTADRAHEESNLKDTDEALARLELELENIVRQQDGSQDILDKKKVAYELLESEVSVLDEWYNAQMQAVADANARRGSLEQQIAQNNKRLETLQARKAQLETDKTAMMAQQSSAGDSKAPALQADIDSVRQTIADLEKQKSNYEKDMASYKEKLETAVPEKRAAQDRLSALQVEIEMLEQFFDKQESGDYAAVLDDITPDSGFEKALSRALGDSLMASLDESAPVSWRARKASGDFPALPDGCKAMVDHVKAPSVLKAALSQIGYVADAAKGAVLSEKLKVGQSLVSPDGTYWRWDGLSIKAEAADRHAVHMEQKNKLAALKKELPTLQKKLDTAAAALSSLEESNEIARVQLQSIAGDLRVAENLLHSKQVELVQAQEQRSRFEEKARNADENIRLVEEDIKTLAEVLKWDQDRLNALTDGSHEEQEKALETLRSELSEKRDSYNEALRVYERFVQEQNSLKARERAIADERVSLKNRNIRSRERLKELSERGGTLSERLGELKIAPADDGAAREKLLVKIAELERVRDAAAEALSVCEKEVYETNRALKEAEAALGDMREKRAAAQATLAGIQESLGVLTTSVTENFSMEPRELKSHLTIDMPENFGSAYLAELKSNKDQQVQERERMGAVNLRAEEELAELDKEVSGLFGDRDELIQAISELRGGIATINKEARERLMKAFDLVNCHFQQLFTQLFVGGAAHLALVGSDDPLEAGLEIFAQPPGKALQSLSLLSGGEQTMASIALIFAMFLTNPSPICVMDEIDAPLDDSNVDRVCNLLESIAARGETRFLVVTHHRLTMARMDRLYGVTMAERGVSQLVSVDLQQSFDFLEAA